jgi:negative regulator of flagellin synthesis FlgM
MNIFGVFSTQGAQALPAAKGVEAIKTEAVRAAEGASDIRMDKVAAIKAAIADGSYETPEKLDAALDRLLDRLG